MEYSNMTNNLSRFNPKKERNATKNNSLIIKDFFI